MDCVLVTLLYSSEVHICFLGGMNSLFSLNRRNELVTVHRIDLNKKRTVAMLHQLRYGLSQKCNWYQCVHSVFLKDCHLRQQGLSAELLVGSSCSTQKTNEILHKLSSDNSERSMSLLRKQFHVNGNL